MKPIIRYTGTIAPRGFPRAKESRGPYPAIDRWRSIAVTAMVVLAVAHLGFGSPSADAQPAPQSAGPAAATAAPAADSAAVGSNSAQPSAPAAAGAPAAPGAAAAMGSGPEAGAAAAAAPAKPSVIEVPCDNTTSVSTFTGVVDGEVATGSVVKFALPPSADIIPDNQVSAGLEVKAGQTKCVRFDNDGVYLFHSSTKQHGAITARQWYDILVNKPIDDLRGGNFWMPKAVNLTADDSDLMYYAVLGLSIFFFVAITAGVIYLVIKYRHRPGRVPEPSPAHNDALEITWTVIPTIICVFLFYYGWSTYVRVVTPPTKAVEINVLAWRWNWQFTHVNGVQDSDLHVPVNTPVRLVMTSKDVLHSFYAPVMRVKQDIIPRRYTYAWFFPTKPGTYRLTCAEYCGTNHSQMGITNDGRRAVLVVHEPGGYERYLADKAALSTKLPPEQLGKLLYEKKGCNACHTVDGTQRVGPTFLHDFGTMVPLSDGTQVKMDENYIRESVLYPQAKARPGYPPSMPSFEGQLKENEILGIIAYIKSLK
jgi:cytochrome c oxidase subunit 2